MAKSYGRLTPVIAKSYGNFMLTIAKSYGSTFVKTLLILFETCGQRNRIQRLKELNSHDLRKSILSCETFSFSSVIQSNCGRDGSSSTLHRNDCRGT
ncbi:hypothetical protein RRG08_047137 [Elysia crispata]|uniref:Uncharacterized protein n=1 Tax=Elysia crispata TaxID=231223 RepID=A0AAE1ANT0_9GAST|nr:hypothetical protein RRG08_047137 [Elysia crispata]